MLFNTFGFLVFFPIATGVYFLVPKKYAYLWLLVCSYFFYMCWNAKYALLLFASTLITYLCGLALEWIKGRQWQEKKQRRYKKLALLLCILSNLTILAYFKYFNFGVQLVSNFLDFLHIPFQAPHLDVLLPVGISFYTFQALSYSIDVYRGDIYAERNFCRYALFVSFFLQLVAGPIERSENLLKQLAKPRNFDFSRAKRGVLFMLFGYFAKMVVADRIAVFVDYVYQYYQDCDGLVLIAATVLFAFQIYCDFYGYSAIAKGAALVMNIDLVENFHAPYLSCSVSEFWRNWHISLTSWFKDYVYIPLGGGRKGKARKYCNKMAVFLISGLWHGAGLSYVIWGALNGFYQIAGEMLMPVRRKIRDVLHMPSGKVYTLCQMLVTFSLVDFAWIFFRADSLSTAFGIIRRMMISSSIAGFISTATSCGLNKQNLLCVLVSVAILLLFDLCKKKDIDLADEFSRLPWLVQSVLLALAISAVLVFGIWGPQYNQQSFIYFQF